MDKGRTFKALAGYGACAGLATGLFSHLTAPYLSREGVPPQAIGLFFSVMTATSALAVLAGGWLADFWGRRAPMVLGQVSLILALILFVFSRSPLALLTVAVCGGLFALREPGVSVLLARGDGTATKFGMYNALATSMAVGAPLLGGLLAQRLGVLIVYLLAIIPALAGLLFIGVIQDNRVRADRAPQFIRGRSIPWAVLAVWGITGLELGLTRPVLGLIMQARFQADWLDLGMLAATGGFGAVLGMLVGGRLSDRVGRVGVIRASLVLNGLALLMLILSRSWTQGVGWFFAANLAAGVGVPALYALTMDAVDEANRGRLAGFAATALNLGAVLGAASTGFFYARAYWLSFVLGAAGLMMVGLFSWPLLRGIVNLTPPKGQIYTLSAGPFILLRVTKK